MKLVRTPLRISLAGGGSDVPSHYEENGGAVLSFTIDKYIYITAKPNVSLFPHNYRLVYSTVEEVNDRSLIQHPIIKELLKNYRGNGLDLDVMSDVPSGTGLGSSSAFTVGLIKTLNDIYYCKYSLAKAACDLEINKLKEPIGKQDQYASVFGGINYFNFSKECVRVSPISLTIDEEDSLESTLHLLYVGGRRKASDLLKEQFLTKKTKTLNRMADLAYSAYIALKYGRIQDIGMIVQEGWELKKQLSPNISNERIDSIISTALSNGATGGKLLGAGGAGFVLLCCSTEKYPEMSVALRKKHPDLKEVPFRIDWEGSKTLYENQN